MYTTVGVGQVLSYILPVRLNIEKKPWAIFKETTLFMVGYRLRAVPLRSVTSKLGRTGESEFTRARKARVRGERKPRGSWGEGGKGGRDCILF